MYIREMRVRNYLIHKDTTVVLKPLTVFVGPQGGGKSAFFDALLNFSMVSRGNLRQAFGPYKNSAPARRTVPLLIPTPTRKPSFAPEDRRRVSGRFFLCSQIAQGLLTVKCLIVRAVNQPGASQFPLRVPLNGLVWQLVHVETPLGLAIPFAGPLAPSPVEPF